MLSGHGVFNTKEFYGYKELDFGTISESASDGACNVVEITVEVMLNSKANNDIKIHFDAYGDHSSGPYSHDATACYWPGIPPLVIPEFPFGTILGLTAFVTALAFYNTRRISIRPK